MSRKEEVLTYCQKMNKPLTAKEIVNGLYPGKAQPFVNHLLIDLVEEKKLVRNDDERPYTVRPVQEGEVIEQVRSYSRKKKPSHNERSREEQNNARQEQGASGEEPYASQWGQDASAQTSAEPARQGKFNYLDNWEKLEYHLRQLEQCLWLLVRERMGD